MTEKPKHGDHVEVTYRGVLDTMDGDGILINGIGWLPETGVVRVVEPPEPTVVNTIVTGWAFPEQDAPEALYTFVLYGRDGDGDGAPCWHAPGGTHEYRWEDVLEATKHGRRIIAPPTAP